MFSGIGGFALAAREVWGEEYENIGFCDNDYFCQQVLQKNFPQATIFTDIRIITNPYREGHEGSQTEAGRNRGYADLVTGGFPCQPFSIAGKRRGTADDRYLWPEMLRVIQEFQPTWVIGENVGGFITWNDGMVLEQVCTDLETSGFEVQPFVIPAVSVNAPHRRDRIWIIAYSEDNSLRRLGLERKPDTQAAEHGSEDSYAPDARRERWQKGFSENLRPKGQGTDQSEYNYPDWSRGWQEVAFATCFPRMDDGIPRRVVRLPDGTTITEAKWRQEAIKAYGNAIVPQVAMQIMEAIKEAERSRYDD